MCEHHEWKKNENSMWFFFLVASLLLCHLVLPIAWCNYLCCFFVQIFLCSLHISQRFTRVALQLICLNNLFLHIPYIFIMLLHTILCKIGKYFSEHFLFLSLFIIIFFLAALFLCARLVHCWRMWIHFFSVHCHCAPMLFAVRSSTNTLWCGWIFYFGIRNNASFSSSANANEIITEHESKEKSHWPSTENEFFVNHWPAALRSRTN